MPVEDYLGKDEEILARYGLHERTGIFYATNKRIIKWKKLLIGEDFSDLAYRNITSLEHRVRPRYVVIAGGGFLVILGILIPGVTALIGLALIAIGFYFKKATYAFKAPGLTGSDANKWSFNVPWHKAQAREESLKFAFIVRENLT